MFYNIILFIMNTKVKIINLSEKEMVMNFAGDNWASQFVQWLGAQYHLGVDRYMRQIEKEMEAGTAWRLTD